VTGADVAGGARSAPGTIVVLNGTPRSGKSRIAAAVQESSDSLWLTFGVDAMAEVIPPGVRPGIGLRPGGERPDLEDVVVTLFAALYSAVAAWSRAGINVVVDVGHHDDYSKTLGILTRTAGLLQGLPAYFIGVRCPVEVIMARRDADPGDAGHAGGQGGRYVTSKPDGSIPDVVSRWERAVHDVGVYDLEVDTSAATPEACAAAILGRVNEGPPVAFVTIAELYEPDR
jgi:chloramphenicol 3-O phosphotransferase